MRIQWSAKTWFAPGNSYRGMWQEMQASVVRQSGVRIVTCCTRHPAVVRKKALAEAKPVGLEPHRAHALDIQQHDHLPCPVARPAQITCFDRTHSVQRADRTASPRKDVVPLN